MQAPTPVHAEPAQSTAEQDPNATFPHVSAAYEYGKQAAELRESVDRTWDELEPLLASGWATRHQEVCGCHMDWRVSFPRVKEGWQSVHP
jgi:hypothetical protein